VVFTTLDPHPLPFLPLSSLCPLCEPCFLIFRTNERGIAPPRREGALTPRCLQGYRGVSGFYDPAIPTLCHFFLCTLCANPFLIFGTNEKRGIAPSRKEEALTPRCLLSPCSLRPLCEPCFFDLWNEQNRGIAPSREEGALTPRCPRTKAYRAVAKRRGAYAATTSLTKNRAIDFGFVS
jgi:hypothetical protein